MTLSKRRNVVAFLEFFTVFWEFLTVMVLTFVLSQCFIVKLLTKPILLFKECSLKVIFKSRCYWILQPLNDKNDTFLFPFFISISRGLENEIVNNYE